MSFSDFPVPLVCEKDSHRIKKAFQSALKGTTGEKLQWRLVRKDGRVIWVEMAWQPIYDDKSMSLGYRGNIRDITEYKSGL